MSLWCLFRMHDWKYENRGDHDYHRWCIDCDRREVRHVWFGWQKE